MHAIPTYPSTLLLLAVAAFFVTPLPAHAQSVSPGNTLNFTTPASGSRQCRTGNAEFNACLAGAHVGTGWSIGRHRVRSLVLRTVAGATVLPSSYAQSALHNEFVVGGTPGNWVKAQVSTAYDINQAQIAMLGNAYSEITLYLEIRDVTHGAGFAVGTHELYQLRRDNTQGFTDIAGAQERQIKPGESGQFDLMLLTGRKYRLSFVLEVMTGAFAGGGDARATASWRQLSVSLDEDEVEMLDDLAVALEQHDKDIKQRLDHVDDELRDIKALLRTPPGRREGWNGRP